MSTHESPKAVPPISQEHPLQSALQQHSLPPPPALVAPDSPAPAPPASMVRTGILSMPQQLHASPAQVMTPAVRKDPVLLSSIILAMVQTQQINTQLMMVQQSILERMLADRRLEDQQRSLQVENSGKIEDIGPSSQKRPADQHANERPSVPAKIAKTALQVCPSGPTIRVISRLPIKCHGCGNRGYKVKECWKVQGKCYRCGSVDHQVRECPMPARSNIPTPEVPQAVLSTAKGKSPQHFQSRSEDGKELDTKSAGGGSAEGSCC